jgi:hypothetical protein
MDIITKLENDLIAFDLKLDQLSADYGKTAQKVRTAKQTKPDTEDPEFDRQRAVASAEAEHEETRRLWQVVLEQRKACSALLEEEVEKVLSAKQPKDKFITLYGIELYEFSPAEGGCWATWYEGVACFPTNSPIVRDAVYAYAEKTKTDSRQVDMVEAMRDYFRKTEGLVFRGDTVVVDHGDGHVTSRTVRDYRSTSPEAKHIVCLEDLPFENRSTERARYE